MSSERSFGRIFIWPEIYFKEDFKIVPNERPRDILLKVPSYVHNILPKISDQLVCESQKSISLYALF